MWYDFQFQPPAFNPRLSSCLLPPPCPLPLLYLAAQPSQRLLLGLTASLVINPAILALGSHKRWDTHTHTHPDVTLKVSPPNALDEPSVFSPLSAALWWLVSDNTPWCSLWFCFYVSHLEYDSSGAHDPV